MHGTRVYSVGVDAKDLALERFPTLKKINK